MCQGLTYTLLLTAVSNVLPGTSAGLGDLHPHTPTTLTSSQVTLSHISHGTTAVTTVTCRNSAGLQATFSSDGVTVLLTPPTNYSAYLAISSPVLTVYQSRDSHVASENVTLHWGGFIEAAGTPLLYEVCLGEGGEGSCVMVGSERQLVIDGVGMASYEEEVSVAAVNLAGLHSPPVQGRVVFQTRPPLDTGKPDHYTPYTTFDYVHVRIPYSLHTDSLIYHMNNTYLTVQIVFGPSLDCSFHPPHRYCYQCDLD